MKALTRAFLDHETKNATLAELPSLIGELARSHAEAFARLTAATPPPASVDVLTPARLAEMWRTSPAAVRELCRSGAIPAKKIGPKLWGIPMRELEAWMQKRDGA